MKSTVVSPSKELHIDEFPRDGLKACFIAAQVMEGGAAPEHGMLERFR